MENDVIMTRIRERLQYDLPFNMLWFCYTQEDYESLPNWLKESSDVRFVVPISKEEKVDELKSLDKKVLPAKDVFSAIISKFEIELPSLLANPIDYILQLTKSILPNDESIFPIKTWKQRLDYMEEHITAVERYLIEIEEAAAKKSIVELTDKVKKMDISNASRAEVIVEALPYILKYTGKVLDKIPEIRGSRCDLASYSGEAEYALDPNHPLVQKHYEQLAENLLKHGSMPEEIREECRLDKFLPIRLLAEK